MDYPNRYLRLATRLEILFECQRTRDKEGVDIHIGVLERMLSEYHKEDGILEDIKKEYPGGRTTPRNEDNQT